MTSQHQYRRIPLESERREDVDRPLSTPRYATIEDLSKWMPSIDPQSRQSKTITWYLSRRPTALGIQLLLTIFILAINITVTVYGRLKYGGPVDSVATTIYTGSCDKIDRYGAAIHFLINLLSTGALGASNFSMQILVAPTRAEVDKAHRQQKWFDIGVTSFRNLRMVNRLHAFLFIILGASSAILHLLWNSAVFNSFPFISYRTAYVTSDYLNNTIIWNVTDTFVAEMQTDAIQSYEKLNRTECITRYMNPQSGAGNVVVVTTWPNNNLTLNDSSSLIESFGMTTTNNWDRIDDWMYHSPAYQNRPYSVESLLPYAHNWSVGVGDDEQWACPVEYCLGQPVIDMDDFCGIHFNQTIMFIVCAANFVKVLCLFYTWTNSFRRRARLDESSELSESKPTPLDPEKETLVTIGDALQSFLNKSDYCTEGMCLASQSDFQKKRWIPGQKFESRQWKGGQILRKFKMARKRDWILTLAGCTSTVIIVLGLFYRTLLQQQLEGVNTSFSAIWEAGIGQAHAMTIVQILNNQGPSQFWGAVLFANSWQLALSILYFLYNTLLTRLCVSLEWSHFGIGSQLNQNGPGEKSNQTDDPHKFLRTSTPVGSQRSTYFLSLPFRYSIPLSTGMLLLHWLISQSIFVIRSAAYLPNGKLDDTGASSRVGYSSLGMILCLIIGSALIMMLIFIGFQKTNFQLPFVSTCSAAISAACHRPEEDINAAVLPVKWGVVSEPVIYEDEPGHCSLTTSYSVKRPETGALYR